MEASIQKAIIESELNKILRMKILFWYSLVLCIFSFIGLFWGEKTGVPIWFFPALFIGSLIELITCVSWFIKGALDHM